ncbi:voltage-gated chloride channel family protein [Chitinibacter fontanus]|uniref:Voltage-gated chloride channel family protein n=1 Tax=Chitinibacter fontanus TaxID=1737446 RepID=A0A7D5VB15_9NEIS|nr:voltage-gated chloride channel family protein [Chitinibacter fontanus]QLI82611.1 voltage-gated chloride channel family protein [Chitinibacter fontanus]
MSPNHSSLHYYRTILHDLLLWLPLASLVGVLGGSAAAGFLWALVWVTDIRVAHPQLIWGLPIAGFVVGWLYLRFGKEVEAGNNLLIDEIHNPKAVIPLRMAPLVLFGTLVSHLFGASVGREGTAVQMGGALADQLTLITRRNQNDRRVLLMAGISAGFAGVFGTPMAGAVFGVEVLALGMMRNNALLPCLIAAFVADFTVSVLGGFLGVHHTHYSVGAVPEFSLWLGLLVLIAGAIFGGAGKLFADSTHWLGKQFKRIRYAPLRPVLGGSILALVVMGFGAERYIGLGIPVIVEAFTQPLSWADAPLKLLFTVFSLGAGFKGGEVTPLFFIGATLGNALAPVLDLPFPLLAGLGFVAVFAGATNTPLACTLMAIELFGAPIAPFALLACTMAHLCSGYSGIYKAQRMGSGKGRPIAAEQAKSRLGS